VLAGVVPTVIVLFDANGLVLSDRTATLKKLVSARFAAVRIHRATTSSALVAVCVGWF
jgi:hypothetical protein